MPPKPQESPAVVAETFDPKLLDDKHVTEKGGKVMDGEATLLHMPHLEGRLWQIPRELIVPNPKQPREYFDSAKMLELYNSIKQMGLKHAISCVPVQLDNGEIKLFIIDGERRYRVTGDLKMPTIKTEVIWTASEGDLFASSLILNESHAEHNPIERGKAYKKMIEFERAKTKCGKEAAIVNIAKQLGMSVQKIQNHLRLLTMPVEIQRLIIVNKLPTIGALSLAQSKKEFKEDLNLARVARILLDHPDTDFEGMGDKIDLSCLTRRSLNKAIQISMMHEGHHEAAEKVAVSAPIFAMEKATSAFTSAVHRLLDIPKTQNIKFLGARGIALEKLYAKLIAARKSLNFVLEDLVEPALADMKGRDRDDGNAEEETRTPTPPVERPKQAPAGRVTAQEKLAKVLDTKQPLSAVKVNPLKTEADRAVAVRKLMDRRSVSPPTPPPSAPKLKPGSKRNAPLAEPPDLQKTPDKSLIPNDVYVIHPHHRTENAGIRDDKFKIMPTNDPRYRECVERYDATRSDVILTDERGRVICIPRNNIISLKDYDRLGLGRHAD